MSWPENPMSEAEVRGALALGEPGDDLLLRLLAALRQGSDPLEVLEVDGVGSQALAVVRIGGRRMRLSAEPW